MAQMYLIQEHDKESDSWFFPIGKHKLYRSEAVEFLKEAHIAHLVDIEQFGLYDEEPEYRMILA